ncbi:MAG: thioredoxin domain-containing protein [Desulfurococcales archaeon]|nr:thioredoxin domain-containing protein [Desulfurococcales archaeon]
MPGRLRITVKQVNLNAGVIILLGIVIGGAIYFYTTLAGPTEAALKFYSEPHILTRADDFNELLKEEEKPVAVMFSSKTCPVCRVMEPYWKVLCERDDLPVSFNILMLNRDTMQLFLDYNVMETPTFIVFINGKPVARHVGGFNGDNITSIMLNWALASSGRAPSFLEEELDMFKKHCSECHGAPESIDLDSIKKWITLREDSDPLAAKLSVSIEYGVPLSEYYGGSQNLARVIYEMKGDLSGEQAYKLALFLDSIALIENEGSNKTGSKLDISSTNPVLAAFIAVPFLTGLLSALSPCVFPLLMVYATTTLAKGRMLSRIDSIKALAASASGVAIIGALFLIIGESIGELANILVPIAGLAVLASGVLGYMDIPSFINLGVATKRSLLGFSFLYGFLAVQCSFPLVAGSLLLIASSKLETGVFGLVAFAVGVSIPVSIVVLSSQTPKFKSILGKMDNDSFRRYSYLALAFMGFLLVIYSLNLI